MEKYKSNKTETDTKYPLTNFYMTAQSNLKNIRTIIDYSYNSELLIFAPEQPSDTY